MLLDVKAEVTTLGKRIKVIDGCRKAFELWWLPVKDCFSERSDALGAALKAQVFDELPGLSDFPSCKFAVQAKLDVAARLQLPVQSCKPLGGVFHVMKHSTALNNVIVMLKMVCIQDVQLMELNGMHVARNCFSSCVGQAFLADVNRSDVCIFVATGIDDLITGAASRDQNVGAGVGR